jgi:CMP-N-acetylneuraminic acid synthetase
MPTSPDARRHLAVIPARGGSKRLPRKNIVDFFGKPILAYSIQAARTAKIFDRILVSTDDDEIALAARRFRAEVDRRPLALGGDNKTVVEVCIELLERLTAKNEKFDTLTVLYSTAPLRNALDIKKTHALLQPGRCDYAMAATEFLQPVHQAMLLKADGVVEPVFSGLVNKRASDVGRYVVGNGSTYCAMVPAFLRDRSFTGGRMRAHLMPLERSVDIDTADDLELAWYYGRRLLKAASGSTRAGKAAAAKKKSRRH